MTRAPAHPASHPPLIASGNLRSDLDLTTPELHAVLDLAATVKAQPAEFRQVLQGKYVSLLFEKPSLRTRLTFELAAKQLGADSVLTTGAIGGREPIKDVARNLARWTHCIVARTFAQDTVDTLATWARIPVVNALSEMYHPCQVLADMQTLREHWGELPGHKLTFVGDGNNVAHSLMLDCARLGVDFAVVTPPGFEPDSEIVKTAQLLASEAKCKVDITNDSVSGLAGAHAIYTDVWASMGQEQEWHERARLFAAYQVNADLYSMARPNALIMHCLPAHRDEEITDDILELPSSIIFDQAENRLHAQKALLIMLMLTGGHR